MARNSATHASSPERSRVRASPCNRAEVHCVNLRDFLMRVSRQPEKLQNFIEKERQRLESAAYPRIPRSDWNDGKEGGFVENSQKAESRVSRSKPREIVSL